MDQDNIGDVCDDDIDGDGRANPINIIDESENINIEVARKAQTGYDNCYLDPTNTDCENQSTPYTALAIAITDRKDQDSLNISAQ